MDLMVSSVLCLAMSSTPGDGSNPMAQSVLGLWCYGKCILATNWIVDVHAESSPVPKWDFNFLKEGA